MAETLQKRINNQIKAVFHKREGDWLVWCDPQGTWLPLLRKVSEHGSLGRFPLVVVDKTTAGNLGSPLDRRIVQRYIDVGDSFVLYVPVAPNALGWLWAQALLAEETYTTSLREQLRVWGWRPNDLTMDDKTIGQLALQKLQQDPISWGEGGLQADPDRLLQVLAGTSEPNDEDKFQIELAIEGAGLPPLPATTSDLVGWRQTALAHLLVTELYQATPGCVPADSKWLVNPSARPQAVILLQRWADSLSLAAALPDQIEAADKLAGLGNLATNAKLPHGPFVSQAAERVLFTQTCARLAQQQGKLLIRQLIDAAAAFEKHKRGLWGGRFHEEAPQLYVPWSELLRLSAAAQTLDAATPAEEWSSPQAAIDWYTNGGWRMDQAGEEIQRRLTHSTPELVALITALRKAHRARWEETLIAWSTLWVSAGCPLPTQIGSAGSWLKEQLDGPPRATVILVLDALRYDLAASLVADLNRIEGVERAILTPVRAPLPSITALGMGLALPLAETELIADLEGKTWQLKQKGKELDLSNATNRRQWWQTHKKVPATHLLDLQTVLNQEIPQPKGPSALLVVHDAALDKLGHDDELEFQGSSEVRKGYLATIERLRDHGWRRILIVTDHGFIHWSNSEEKNAERPAPNPTYSSRRALAYPTNAFSPTDLGGPQALAPGGRWRIACPYGAASFRAYGALGYFHGGASLQEWIIPCVAVEWPQTAQPVQVMLQPLSRILSKRPKVVLQVSGSSLFAEDAMSRQVEVIIRDKTHLAILFRSAPVTVALKDAMQELTLQAESEAKAERNTPLLIEVREVSTERQLYQIESTLMIALTGW